MLQGENWVMAYLSTCNDEWVWVFFWKLCDSPSALKGTPSTQTLSPFSWTTQEWPCATPAHHPVAYHDRSILASHSYQPVLELLRQPINDTHMIAIQLIYSRYSQLILLTLLSTNFLKIKKRMQTSTKKEKYKEKSNSGPISTHLEITTVDGSY